VTDRLAHSVCCALLRCAAKKIIKHVGLLLKHLTKSKLTDGNASVQRRRQGSKSGGYEDTANVQLPDSQTFFVAYKTCLVYICLVCLPCKQLLIVAAKPVFDGNTNISIMHCISAEACSNHQTYSKIVRINYSFAVLVIKMTGASAYTPCTLSGAAFGLVN